MRNKYIIALVVVGAVLLIGVAIYYYIASRQEEAPEEVVLTEEERSRLSLSEEERAAGKTLQDKEEELKEEKQEALESGDMSAEEIGVVQIRKIIDKKINFPVFSANKEQFLYHDPQAREFFQSNTDGTGEQAITNANFENLYDVSWSPNRRKLVLAFSPDNGRNKEYHYFDLVEQKDIKYEANYQDVTISFDGDRVAYVYYDEREDSYNLSVANADLSSWRKIKKVDEEEINLNWFSNTELASYTPSPTAYAEGQLIIYNIEEGSDCYTLLSKRWGLSPLFSPDGKKVLYNDNDTKNARFPEVWVTGINNDSDPRKLQLSTLVEKCAWAPDSVSIFCGVPENYSNFFIQPDDYYKGKFISNDSFYKINTDTGEQVKLADASQFSQDYDVYSPLVSEDQKSMYFTRKHDGKFYALIVP